MAARAEKWGIEKATEHSPLAHHIAHRPYAAGEETERNPRGPTNFNYIEIFAWRKVNGDDGKVALYTL